MSFPDTWNYVQTFLSPGDSIKNWTKDRGYLGDEFTILRVSPSIITVDTPGAINLQHVPKSDFEGVYNIWTDYVGCRYRRQWIRDEITRYSKYIISILRWVEDQNDGNLP
jgi:hypothetical protein